MRWIVKIDAKVHWRSVGVRWSARHDAVWQMGIEHLPSTIWQRQFGKSPRGPGRRLEHGEQVTVDEGGRSGNCRDIVAIGRRQRMPGFPSVIGRVHRGRKA